MTCTGYCQRQPVLWEESNQSDHLAFNLYFCGSLANIVTISLRRFLNAIALSLLSYLNMWVISRYIYICIDTGRGGRIGRAQYSRAEGGEFNSGRIKEITYTIETCRYLTWV